jgi:hypothetical protein
MSPRVMVFSSIVCIVTGFGLALVSMSNTSAPVAERLRQRFDRVGMSEFDPFTRVDVFRDNVTGQCYAVYKRSSTSSPVGTVPCR